MRKVEQVNYADLVRRMYEAGFGEGMDGVLKAQLLELGHPETKNEAGFFWASLNNAIHRDGSEGANQVWLWLQGTPFIRHFAGDREMDVPVIGGEDDGPWEPIDKNIWPAEETEDNFVTQAAALDNLLQEEGKKNPKNRCKTIGQYVATWYHSGTGRMMAQIQLIEGGYLALASQKGLDWLMATYPA